MKIEKRRMPVLTGLLAMCLLLSLLSGLLPTPASAASSSEIKIQIRELKEEKKALEEMMENLESQIQENATEIEAIVAQKNIIDQEVFLLHEQVANINEQLSAFNVLIADKQFVIESCLEIVLVLFDMLLVGL